MAVGTALVEEDTLEREVIGRRAVEAAAAHLEFRLLRDFERDRRQGAVLAARMHADEPGALLGGQPEAGGRHADRPEQMRGEIVAELLPADPLDRQARPVDADAVIPLGAG